jgi:hypothetical protein
MIHVAISLPDDVGATLEGRARDEGFADLADYLRALAEADARDETVVQVSPEVAALLEEADKSGYVPYNFEEIMAEARAEFDAQ